MNMFSNVLNHLRLLISQNAPGLKNPLEMKHLFLTCSLLQCNSEVNIFLHEANNNHVF